MRYAAFAACAAGLIYLAGKPALRMMSRESRLKDESKITDDSVGKSAAVNGEASNGKSRKSQNSTASSNGNQNQKEQKWFSDSGVLGAMLNVAQWPLDYIEKKTGHGSEVFEEAAEQVEGARLGAGTGSKSAPLPAPAVVEASLPNHRLVEARLNTVPAKSIYYKDIESEAALCLKKQKAARKAVNGDTPGSKSCERGLWKDPDFGPEDSSLSAGLVGLPRAQKQTGDGQAHPPAHPLADAIGQIVAKGQSVPWKIPRDFSTSRKQPGHREDGEGTWVHVDIADILESAAMAKKTATLADPPLVNRYFATAVALVMQSNPLMCDSLIDLTHEAQGIYGATFFVDGKWSIVWTDSYFPCYPPLTGVVTERARTLFPSITDQREIWTLVIEKAFAKLHHSYEEMLNVPLNTVLEQVTGGDANLIDLSPHRASAGSPGTLWRQIEKASMGRGGGLLSMSGAGGGITFLAATSRPLLSPSAKDANGNSLEDAAQMYGIGHGLTYAVVAAVEAAGQRLLLLRAPPGAGEWSGDWSPSSSSWSGESGAAVRAAVDAVKRTPQLEGDFWISFLDFVQRFDGLATLRMKVSAEELALRNKVLDCVHSAGAGRAALSPGLEMRYKHLMQRAVADRMAQELLSSESQKRKKSVKSAKAKPAGKGVGKGAKADKGPAGRIVAVKG
jgi:hypothetical protein